MGTEAARFPVQVLGLSRSLSSIAELTAEVSREGIVFTDSLGENQPSFYPFHAVASCQDASEGHVILRIDANGSYTEEVEVFGDPGNITSISQAVELAVQAREDAEVHEEPIISAHLRTPRASRTPRGSDLGGVIGLSPEKIQRALFMGGGKQGESQSNSPRLSFGQGMGQGGGTYGAHWECSGCQLMNDSMWGTCGACGARTGHPTPTLFPTPAPGHARQGSVTSVGALLEGEGEGEDEDDDGHLELLGLDSGPATPPVGSSKAAAHAGAPAAVHAQENGRGWAGGDAEFGALSPGPQALAPRDPTSRPPATPHQDGEPASPAAAAAAAMDAAMGGPEGHCNPLFGTMTPREGAGAGAGRDVVNPLFDARGEGSGGSQEDAGPLYCQEAEAKASPRHRPPGAGEWASLGSEGGAVQGAAGCGVQGSGVTPPPLSSSPGGGSGYGVGAGLEALRRSSSFGESVPMPWPAPPAWGTTPGPGKQGEEGEGDERPARYPGDMLPRHDDPGGNPWISQAAVARSRAAADGLPAGASTAAPASVIGAGAWARAGGGGADFNPEDVGVGVGAGANGAAAGAASSSGDEDEFARWMASRAPGGVGGEGGGKSPALSAPRASSSSPQHSAATPPPHGPGGAGEGDGAASGGGGGGGGGGGRAGYIDALEEELIPPTARMFMGGSTPASAPLEDPAPPAPSPASVLSRGSYLVAGLVHEAPMRRGAPLPPPVDPELRTMQWEVAEDLQRLTAAAEDAAQEREGARRGGEDPLVRFATDREGGGRGAPQPTLASEKSRGMDANIVSLREECTRQLAAVEKEVGMLRRERRAYRHQASPLQPYIPALQSRGPTSAPHQGGGMSAPQARGAAPQLPEGAFTDPPPRAPVASLESRFASPPTSSVGRAVDVAAGGAWGGSTCTSSHGGDIVRVQSVRRRSPAELAEYRRAAHSQTPPWQGPPPVPAEAFDDVEQLRAGLTNARAEGAARESQLRGLQAALEDKERMLVAYEESFSGQLLDHLVSGGTANYATTPLPSSSQRGSSAARAPISARRGEAAPLTSSGAPRPGVVREIVEEFELLREAEEDAEGEAEAEAEAEGGDLEVDASIFEDIAAFAAAVGGSARPQQGGGTLEIAARAREGAGPEMALARLRSLVGEAYALQMVLKSALGGGGGAGAGAGAVVAALDEWTVASHTLRKACDGALRGKGGKM